MMKQGDANGFYESWSGAAQLAAAAVEMLGDETFTKSAGGYKWHLGNDELDEAAGSEKPAPGRLPHGPPSDEGLEELSIDLMLRSDGSVELKYTAAMNVEGGGGVPHRLYTHGEQQPHDRQGSGPAAQYL